MVIRLGWRRREVNKNNRTQNWNCYKIPGVDSHALVALILLSPQGTSSDTKIGFRPMKTRLEYLYQRGLLISFTLTPPFIGSSCRSFWPKLADKLKWYLHFLRERFKVNCLSSKKELFSQHSVFPWAWPKVILEKQPLEF